MSAALGTRLEFEPRRRGDAQFVFVGAQPVQGRSLRPALRFHLAEDLPVYATSDIFEPDAQANNDLEGVIFPDMPWVISPDAVSTQLRTALSKHWPVRARGRGRLYAFGFDAYRLVPLLKAGKFGSAHAVPGMTGLLSIDSKGRVQRELDWAQVAGGKPTPLALQLPPRNRPATRTRSSRRGDDHGRSATQGSGPRGEATALAHLQKRGLQLVLRNFGARPARSTW